MSELYELPEGWEWKKLEDVCDLLNGFAFKAKEYVDKSNTVIIRMGNIRPDGQFNAEHKIKYLPNKYARELPKYILKDGDLIIAMTDLATEMRILGNPTLVSNLKGRTFMLNQRVGKLYDFNNDKIIIEYLRYIITAPQVKDYYKSLGGGGLQINIGKQQILSAQFPLPSLQEQKRIVAILDALFAKIDKAIALHQKNMDEADAFMRSVLNDVFGELEEKYEKRTLGNITKTTSGGTPKRNEKSYWGGKIGWLKSGELNNGYITKVQEFITEKGLKKSSAKLFPKGTLLIAMYGATVGKLGILNIETTTNQAICGVLNDKSLFETKYMFYFFQKNKEKMLLDSTGGAQPNISQTYLKQLDIILPPLPIQQKTVTYLDSISQKIENLKQVQKEKMQSLVALKASILDQAFRGKL